MSARMQGASPEAVERLHNAMNQHDLGAFLACFDRDYRSEQPAHPSRGFGGREQVEKNWAALFEAMPDFHAELLATATEGDTVWSEWHWTGTRRASDAPLDNDFTSQITRFKEAGADIDETVRRLAEGNRLDGE